MNLWHKLKSLSRGAPTAVVERNAARAPRLHEISGVTADGKPVLSGKDVFIVLRSDGPSGD
jgi:hypothetical protein